MTAKILVMVLQLAIFIIQYLAKGKGKNEAEMMVARELLLHVQKLVRKADEASTGADVRAPDELRADPANRDGWAGTVSASEGRGQSGP